MSNKRDPNWTLKEWKEFINSLIEQHGEEAILTTNGSSCKISRNVNMSSVKSFISSLISKPNYDKSFILRDLVESKIGRALTNLTASEDRKAIKLEFGQYNMDIELPFELPPNAEEQINYKGNLYYVKDDLMWIRVAKNASTTITKCFCSDGDFNNLCDVDLDEINKIFMVVRNPFDRLVSCWINRVGINKKMRRNPELLNTTFPEFVRLISDIPDEEADHHFRSQFWYIKPLLKEFDKIKFFKMETLNDDWNELCEFIGKDVKMSWIKRSVKRSYTTFYTPELKLQS
jgi:hypothetical protein